MWLLLHVELKKTLHDFLLKKILTTLMTPNIMDYPYRKTTFLLGKLKHKENDMKRMLGVLLCIVMVLAFIGCQKKAETPAPATPAAPTATVTTPQPAAQPEPVKAKPAVTQIAIATAAASNAKKNDLSIAVSISIIFTVIMMVFEPMIIKASGMNQLMGGSLIGGTIDSTGAVVVAGTALGPEAQQAAVLVKSIQNILIGFIAFFVAIFFATRVENSGVQKVGAEEIWTRFPKFILGFFAASLIASFLIQPVFGSDSVNSINKVLDQYKNWAFVLAFTSIGLDTNFKEIARQMQGGKVLWLYIIGQTFNIGLTLFAVWFLLSGVVFPVPVLD